MTLLNRWRRWACRHGWGCDQCGRMTFARTTKCRTHLTDDYDRAMREYVERTQP